MMDFLATLAIIPILQLKNPILPQPTPTTTVMVETKKKQTKPKPIIYKVKSGDSLTTISKARRVPVSRLWSANKQLDHPDIIHVGQRLRIPRAGDKLKKRAMIKNVIGGSSLSIAPTSKPSQSEGFSSTSNSYDYHSCTWWVKEWKPSVSNWNDAKNWGYAAQADGWTVSSTPVVGAVAWSTRGTYGHVALVIGVSNGKVTIKEGNFDWAGSVRTIEVPTSTYQYLYN